MQLANTWRKKGLSQVSLFHPRFFALIEEKRGKLALFSNLFGEKKDLFAFFISLRFLGSPFETWNKGGKRVRDLRCEFADNKANYFDEPAPENLLSKKAGKKFCEERRRLDATGA